MTITNIGQRFNRFRRLHFARGERAATPRLAAAPDPRPPYAPRRVTTAYRDNLALSSIRGGITGSRASQCARRGRYYTCGDSLTPKVSPGDMPSGSSPVPHNANNTRSELTTLYTHATPRHAHYNFFSFRTLSASLSSLNSIQPLPSSSMLSKNASMSFRGAS